MGALWFHRHSAETLELDRKGLKQLLSLFQGYGSWRYLWSRSFLQARGFILPVNEPHQASIQTVVDVLARIDRDNSPLRSRSAPEVVHVSLTEACQQRCGGCFFSQRDRTIPAQFLSPSIFEKLCQEAEQLQVFQLALGGGEPLQHPQLVDFVALGVSHGLVVNLTTSGRLLTPHLLDNLQQAGLGQLQLSLNGSTAAIHGQTRPGYTQVRQAMALCGQMKQRWGLNVLLTRQNLSDLESLFQLAEETGAYSLNLLRPKSALDDPQWLPNHLPTASDNRRLQRFLKRWQKRASFQITTDSSLSFLRAGSSPRWAAQGIFGCTAGRRMLTVQADGQISPCSHVPFKDLAYLGEHRLEDVWQQSQHMARFRRLEDTLTGQCGTCAHKHTCRGCRAVVLGLGGRWEDEDPQCPKHQSIFS